MWTSALKVEWRTEAFNFTGGFSVVLLIQLAASTHLYTFLRRWRKAWEIRYLRKQSHAFVGSLRPPLHWWRLLASPKAFHLCCSSNQLCELILAPCQGGGERLERVNIWESRVTLLLDHSDPRFTDGGFWLHRRLFICVAHPISCVNSFLHLVKAAEKGAREPTFEKATWDIFFESLWPLLHGTEIALFGVDCVVPLWPLLHGTEIALFGVDCIVPLWPLLHGAGINHPAHRLKDSRWGISCFRVTVKADTGGDKECSRLLEYQSWRRSNIYIAHQTTRRTRAIEESLEIEE